MYKGKWNPIKKHTRKENVFIKIEGLKKKARRKKLN